MTGVDDLAKSSDGLVKYQTAVLDKVFFPPVSEVVSALSNSLTFSLQWNALTHQKPTVKVGAAELAQGSMAGYLLKASKALTDKSNTVKNWKSRYFVLKNHCLYYFTGPSDEEALGMIELANIDVEKIADNPEGLHLPHFLSFFHF